MPTFPSEEWFAAVTDRYNNDASLHTGGGGACHTTAGFKIDDDVYEIVFEGLQVGGVRRITEAQLVDSDFYLEMAGNDWRAMLENIREHGRAEFEWTLNSLDLDRDEGIARTASGDQYRQDLFSRYNQNFQDYFDASAGIATSFD